MAFLCAKGMLDAEDFTAVKLLLLTLFWALIFLSGSVLLFSLRHFFRWLFSWRIIKRCLVGAAFLTVLVVGFYAEENWRGRHAWENYRHEWEAKGEKFDFAAFAPPLVPDDQNFAMAPIVVSCYAGQLERRKDDSSEAKNTITNRLEMRPERINYEYDTNMTLGRWQMAKLTDLKPWQDYYRATTSTNICDSGNGLRSVDIKPVMTNEFPVAPQPQSPAADVRLALSRYDAALVELEQAGARPYSRFPLNYQAENPPEIFLPHLAKLKGCVLVLQLRALAELQLGQTEQALADVKLMLRLAEAIRSEPTLISHLVRIALVQIANQPIWEGLAEHRWSDAQLKELEQALQKQDFVADMEFFLRGERANGLGAIEYSRKHRDEMAGMLVQAVCPKVFESIEKTEHWFSQTSPFSDGFGCLDGQWLPDNFISRTVLRLPPDGWFEMNKLNIAKIYQEDLFPMGNPEKHLVARQAMAEAERLIKTELLVTNLNPQNVLAYVFLSYLPGVVHKVAFTQGTVDLAMTACALERYRLAHGEYPEMLAALTPQIIEKIPNDVVNGQPLHYRRMDDGRFLLYSVGWNEKDDGGVVGLTERGRPDPEQGDWVWQYPAKN